MNTSRRNQKTLSLADRLGLDLAPLPHGHWEGAFLHTTSSPNESWFMRAAVGMTGGAFEGEARLSPDAKDCRFVEADLSGSIDGHTITFLVWIRTGEQLEPFTCTATLNARANHMRGTWRHPCYQGESCRCEGGGGIFELRRSRD